MVERDTNEPTRRKSLRLWPGVVIVMLQWLLRFVVPYFVPDFAVYGILAGVLGGGLMPSFPPISFTTSP